MSANSTCADCGAAFTDESPSGDSAQREPCPDCGSTSRRVPLHAEIQIVVSAVAQADVVTYPQTLLSFAKGLIDDGHFNIAVVVSHMACEIATERALADSFVNKEIQYLEAAVKSFLNGYNLTNDRVKRLYTALTGDRIQDHSFWMQFKESATLRNRIVHKGLMVGKSEAEMSHQAASKLIAHLKK